MKKSEVEVLEGEQALNFLADDMANRSRVHRNQYNYTLGQYPGDLEPATGVGETVPGMAEPLRSIIDRFVVGREVPINPGTYHQAFQDAGLDIELAQVANMDKTERYMKAKEVTETIRTNLQSIKSNREKGRENAIRKMQDELEAAQNPPTKEPPITPVDP